MLSRRVAWLALAVALVATPAMIPRTAHATSAAAITVEELTRRSHEVAVVTARAQHSQWLDGAIVTDVDLEVESPLRGTLTAHEHVTLRLPGGVVGRIGQQIAGVPSLELGRSYMVFLSRASQLPGTFYLTHLTASVMPITPPTTTMPAVVTPPGEGLVVAGGSTGTPAVQTPATVMRRNGVPLDGLMRTVRSVR